MEDLIIPDGFLRLSDAVNQLGRGIWGGMRRPAPLRAMKPEDRRGVSVGFGPWKEEAGRQLRTAVIEGKIAVYVFASSQSAIDNLKPTRWSYRKP